MGIMESIKKWYDIIMRDVANYYKSHRENRDSTYVTMGWTCRSWSTCRHRRRRQQSAKMLSSDLNLIRFFSLHLIWPQRNNA